jgi:hypothetical protein
MNREVGARSDCVLTINGSPVDTAFDTWVDAGDRVTCAFTHTFTTSGSFALAVDARNVKPGDWDDTNNSASASIEIVEPVVSLPATWNLDAWSEDYSQRYESSGYYQVNGTYSTGRDWGWFHNADVKLNSVGAYFSTPNAIQHPVRVNMSVTNSAAAKVMDVQGLEPSHTWTDGSTYQCSYDYRPSSEAYVYVNACTYFNGAAGNTWGYMRTHTGTITYHSLGYDRLWYSNPEGSGYHWNYNYDYNGTDNYGTRVPLTTPILVEASLTGADTKTVRVQSLLDLQPVDLTLWSTPLACSIEVSPEYSAKHCYGNEYTGSAASGYKYIVQQ